jgi:hypothetical protein
MSKAANSRLALLLLVLIILFLVILGPSPSASYSSYHRTSSSFSPQIVSRVIIPTWTTTSVGSDSLGSAAVFDNGTINIASLGHDLYDSKDSAMLVHSPLPDGRHQRVDVRCDRPVGSERIHYNAKAALVMRESLDADAAFVGIAVTSERARGLTATVVLLHRASKGGPTVQRHVDSIHPQGPHANKTALGEAMTVPGFPYLGLGKSNVWLRLERHGSLVKGYASVSPRPVKSHWTSLGPPVALGWVGSAKRTAVVGLAVTRGPFTRNLRKAEMTFSNYKLRTIGSSEQTE